MNTQIKDINFSLRKLFLTTTVNFLHGTTSAVKKFQVQFDKDFKFALLIVPAKGGGGKLYYVLQINGDSIYIALHCEGKFSDVDVKEFGELKGFAFNKIQNRLAIIGFVPTKFEDIFPVANAMKVLIESTYPVIDKIF